MNEQEENGSGQGLRSVVLIRVFFILIATLIASLFAWDTRQNSFFFSLFGCGLASTVVLIEISLHGLSSRRVMLGLGGMLIGLLCAQLVYPTLGWLLAITAEFYYKMFGRGLDASNRAEIPRAALENASQFLSQWILGYFGLVTALRHSDWIRLSNLRLHLANPADRAKILDTSVIIDGRVVDLAELGLFEGRVIIPRFVLLELQALADHDDAQKRIRGRRGLDVLEKMKEKCATLDLTDQDFPAVSGVDHKLIEYARLLNGVLYTNDSNLQKIAHLQQVTVVNLHELAEAMRPTVYVGEVLPMRIVKPGKEQDQGVGFLDDGTLVVVDGAARMVGRDCEVIITSILQNPTGRMIFARRGADEAANANKGSAA